MFILKEEKREVFPQLFSFFLFAKLNCYCDGVFLLCYILGMYKDFCLEMTVESSALVLLLVLTIM